MYKRQIVDSTSNDYGFLKTPAIRAYLKDHPNITQYIVVDDLNMENEFHEHAITCPDPVSYTHLDVYKRQACASFLPISSGFVIIICTVCAAGFGAWLFPVEEVSHE